jgi:hypothetical protein
VVSGRGWAYAGAALGSTVSIAANVAHSYVPPAGAPLLWHPYVGAVIGAVFWPVALLVAVEIMARVPWPDGWRWVAVRYLGLLPVAVVAAVVSYRHMSGLLVFYQEDPLTARIGPLAVDGLMVMAAGALLTRAGLTVSPARESIPATGEAHGEPAAEPVQEPPGAPVVSTPAGLTEGSPAPVDEPSSEPVDEPATEPAKPSLVSPRGRARRGDGKVRCDHCGRWVSKATRTRHRRAQLAA